VSAKPIVLVFCERIQNESFCESIVRELQAHYDVRPFGPNWPKTSLSEIASRDEAHFYLELDSASGEFFHPKDLSELSCPKFAWLIDTHKKPDFHRTIAREMDVTFYTMQTWGHVFETPAAWLPLHCDTKIFHPEERERDLDIVFVGSYGWRAEPMLRIAKKHGLKAHVECTTGPREKSETAAIYARSKLVFNRHITNDLNFRVFEAQACGRLLLTDAQWNGQYELFQDGEHCVFYKDERDLEKKILHYLEHEDERRRIEKAAAEHAERCHSTRARVGQLKDAIESYLERVEAERAPLGLEDPKEDGLGERTKRRWLVVAGEAPKTVTGKTYAEGLAFDLAARGHEVVLARRRLGALAPRERVEREPEIVELVAEGLPAAPTDANQALRGAAALHAALTRVGRERGEFDVVLGEGPFAALLAQPFAVREDLPFVLAIPGTEVARRKNRLTRDQLYWAELEHWACDRAAFVVTPDRKAEEDVRSTYKARKVVTVAPEPRVPGIAGTERLARRLGLRDPFVLLLSGDMSGKDAKRLLSQSLVEECDLLLATSGGLWQRRNAQDIRLLSDRAASGPALGALMSSAFAVLALDEADPREREARILGARVALVPPRRQKTLEAILEHVRSAQVDRAARRKTTDVSALEDVLSLACSRREGEVASVQ